METQNRDLMPLLPPCAFFLCLGLQHDTAALPFHLADAAGALARRIGLCPAPRTSITIVFYKAHLCSGPCPDYFDVHRSTPHPLKVWIRLFKA